MYRESVIEAGDSQHFREAAGSEQSNSIYLYKHTLNICHNSPPVEGELFEFIWWGSLQIAERDNLLGFAKDLHCLIELDQNKEMVRHA